MDFVFNKYANKDKSYNYNSIQKFNNINTKFIKTRILISHNDFFSLLIIERKNKTTNNQKIIMKPIELFIEQ